jgi:putative ABC transport system permease protein
MARNALLKAARMLDTIRQDLVVAGRHLRRGRLVTGVAVVSLALGIAANTTVFSLVKALTFPRLIYPDSSRIVFLESRNDARGIAEMMISAPDARDVAASARTLQGMSVAASQSSILRAGDVARRIQGRRVDPAFFDTLRVPPALGRALSDGDEPGVIVLSDGLWRSQFGADPGLVGSPIRLDGGTVTVVGVMPRLFDGDADFWTPLGGALAGAPRDDRQYDLYARVAPGVTVADANAELSALSARLAAAYPATNRGWQVYAVPLSRLHGRETQSSFLLLQAAVGCVLLIACANIANILLARGAGRRREIAVRVALGASRARVIAALLTEAVALAGAGGACGVILAMWGIRLARTLLDFPDVIEPQLDLGVLAFTVAVSIGTGLLCGLGPALRASGVAPEPVLREEGRGATDRSTGRFRAGLVVAQVAFAVLLATSATLLVRSVLNRERVALGFEPRQAFRASLSLPVDRYPDPGRAADAVERVLAVAASSPDIVAAGARTWALPTGAGGQRAFTLPDAGDAALPPAIGRGVEAVTPGCFAALGAPITAGRGFNDGDRSGGAAVAVVNEELARRLWPGQTALGRRLRLGLPADRAPIVTVVGVVASVRRSPMHDSLNAMAYVPYAQYPNRTVTIVARTRGEMAAGVRALTAAVHATDPALFAEGIRSMQDDMAAFTAPLRAITSVLGAFAFVAVLLAALGIFGAMSYAVAERQYEIAVRSALGAARGAILRMVVSSALRLTAAGALLGAVAAAWATRALHAFLFGIGPVDPATYLAVAGALAAIAVGACWRPARIAASVDPMTLLRT